MEKKMNINPLQMQIMTHFKSKIEEQTKILESSNLLINKVRKELPNLMQKVKESELTKGKIDIIENEAVMYKLVGPAMMLMTKKEILSEVNGRLDILNKQLKHQESTMIGETKKAKDARDNMVRIDNEFKYAMQKAQ